MIKFLNVSQEHSDNLTKYDIPHQFAFEQITVEINLSPQERVNEVLSDMIRYIAGIGSRTICQILDEPKKDSLINNIFIKETKSASPKIISTSFTIKMTVNYLLRASAINKPAQQFGRFSSDHNLHRYGIFPAITIVRPPREYEDDVASHDGVYFNFSKDSEPKSFKIERVEELQHSLESIRDCDDQIKYFFENVKTLTDSELLWFMTNIINYKSAKTVINQIKKRDGSVAVFYKIAKDMYASELPYSKVVGDEKFRYDYIHQAVNNPFTKPHKVLESAPAFSQEEQSVRLQGIFEEILDDVTQSIHCLKVDTGTGKTRVMLEDFLSYNMAYLAPTHKLLLQSLADLKKFNPSLFEKTVYFPKIDDDELPDCDMKLELIHARKIGDHKKVKKLQRNIIQQFGTRSLRQKLEQYEKAMKAEEGIPFITFHRFLSTNMFRRKFQNVDTFIVDEDIVKLLFPNFEHADVFVITELIKLNKYIVKQYDLKEGFGEGELNNHKKKLIELVSKIQNVIKIIQENQIITENSHKNFFKSQSEEITRIVRKMVKSGKNIRINYSDILECEMFVKKNNGKATKYYHNNSEALRGKKLIIMSATLDKDVHVPLLSKLINPSVRFHDLGRTKLKGKLHQFADFSTTKFSLSTKPERTELINKVLSESGIENVITYKDYKKDFICPTEQMHFYNSAGYNDLSGKNIAIVGTPNGQAEDVVALGYLIEKKLPKSYVAGTLVFRSQSMFRDEWKLPFYTFYHKDDEFFRKIHLWSTYNELIQAVGRARQTHHENDCYVFSQLPLSQAEIKKYSEVI